VNRLSFFFPALVPALPGTALSIASLHAGQALMLLFMALAALRAARWNARLSLPRFVPFLASLSLVVALAAPWAASGRTRTMIGRLAELQCVLPTSFALFALAVGACVLAVSMLLARDLRAPWLQPARDRSAYALGFLMMSALVPFTFHEIAMIVVGLLAWNHALQGSDGEGIASPSS